MKLLRLPFLAVLTSLLLGSGCGSLDVSRAGNPNRVLSGTIDAGTALPAGAEVVVRLVSAPAGNDTMRTTQTDLPVMATPPAGQGIERVLGTHTQRLTSGTMEPVPFQLEYNAEDAVLRRGLNLDVRVVVGGKLQYRTVNAHVVTLASSPFKQTVVVQAVR